MRIDAVIDTVCPWCFIGKRRLEAAFSQRLLSNSSLRWQPFLLNPDMPAEGMDRQRYLERKFGSGTRVERMLTIVAAAGANEGIDFRFDLIERMPESTLSHRLMAFAELHGCADDALERLFLAFFTQGRDIGDLQVLCAIGDELALPRAALIAFLQNPDGQQEVRAAASKANRRGVTGVPFYLFGNSYAIAGAQDPAVLLRMIDLAQETSGQDSISLLQA